MYICVGADLSLSLSLYIYMYICAVHIHIWYLSTCLDPSVVIAFQNDGSLHPASCHLLSVEAWVIARCSFVGLVKSGIWRVASSVRRNP